MNTYLRAFTRDDLVALTDYTKDSLAFGMSEAHAALTRPANGESIAMPIVCAGWNTRAGALQLPKKGAKRDHDREAYMQGAMAAMVALGVMTVERANQIGFLCAVGRLDQYVAGQAAKDAA